MNIMKKNQYSIKVIGPGSVSLKVGEKLKDLGVKQLDYKPHCWRVETEFTKEELLESLKRIISDKAKITIEEL